MHDQGIFKMPYAYLKTEAPNQDVLTGKSTNFKLVMEAFVLNRCTRRADYKNFVQ